MCCMRTDRVWPNTQPTFSQAIEPGLQILIFNASSQSFPSIAIQQVSSISSAKYSSCQPKHLQNMKSNSTNKSSMLSNTTASRHLNYALDTFIRIKHSSTNLASCGRALSCGTWSDTSCPKISCHGCRRTREHRSLSQSETAGEKFLVTSCKVPRKCCSLGKTFQNLDLLTFKKTILTPMDRATLGGAQARACKAMTWLR